MPEGVREKGLSLFEREPLKKSVSEKMAPRRVYLSYRRDNQQLAGGIARVLKDRGLDVWWDLESLLPGEKIQDASKEGLKKVRHLWFWSPST